MSMGFCLGLLTLYYVWRPVASSMPYTKAMTKDSMFSAALIGTLYWVTGISGGFYPGALFLDPEFIGTKYDQKVLGLPGQATVFMFHALGMWAAYGLETRRLGMLKEA